MRIKNSQYIWALAIYMEINPKGDFDSYKAWADDNAILQGYLGWCRLNHGTPSYKGYNGYLATLDARKQWRSA